LAGLQRAVQVLNTHNYFVLGRGSSLLVSGAGVRAAAITLKQDFERFQVMVELQSM
jgi:UDP-N-acetylenolpyruvoylglucosamine reductase